MTTPDRLWRYREDDADAVQRLAREIGAPFLPEHETRAVKVAWVKLLAEEVGRHTWPVLHKYPESVSAWVAQIQNADGVTLALESVCERIRDEIHRQDYDDGWATDPAGAALESVTLALLPGTRWLAEASKSVWRFATGCGSYNDVVRISQDAWLRHLYLTATDAVQPVSPLKRIADSIRDGTAVFVSAAAPLPEAAPSNGGERG